MVNSSIIQPTDYDTTTIIYPQTFYPGAYNHVWGPMFIRGFKLHFGACIHYLVRSVLEPIIRPGLTSSTAPRSAGEHHSTFHQLLSSA